MSGDCGPYISLSQNYTLLLSCQPKSQGTVFSGPKGELALLNPQLNIEQLTQYPLFNPAATLEEQVKSMQKRAEKEENKTGFSVKRQLQIVVGAAGNKVISNGRVYF